MSENDRAAKFGLGLLIGTVIGLGIGMLYAPRSGSEMRALIRERAGDAREKAKDIIDEARARAKKIIEDARGKAEAEKE